MGRDSKTPSGGRGFQVKRPTKSAPSPALDSVRADEVLPLRGAGRRLGWGVRLQCDLQRLGLRTIMVGRTKMILGRDIIDFLDRLGREQAGGPGQ